MTIQKAARQLRSHLGLSQQAMANKLEISFAALRNYETGAVMTPGPRALSRYMILARQAHLVGIERAFYEAFFLHCGVAPKIVYQ